MADRLIVKVDGYGNITAGQVETENINWISGWYAYLPNISTIGDNQFTIPYSDGYELYDSFSPVLTGGSVSALVTTTETYVCPRKVGAAAITWTDVNPNGVGIGGNYTVDNLFPAHVCRARRADRSPFVYEASDGYKHELFLLFAYSSGLVSHTFFWSYVLSATGTWAIAPGTVGPEDGEVFDMWVPTSTNLQKTRWSAGLVQDNDKLDRGDNVASIDHIKDESTVIAGELDGTNPFTTIDLTGLASSTDVIMGFCNGLEVNVFVGALVAATTTDDIIVDTSSVGYPTVTNVYWNGSSRAPADSVLGDLLLNDVIRLYYITES